MAAARTKQLAGEIARLTREPQQLGSDEGRAAIEAALLSADAALVVQAVRLLAEHGRVDGARLASAYRELAGARAQHDPGCLAKEALLAALDEAEHDDAELFAEAAMYEQYDRAKGGTRETAGRVRARGVLGLARLGHLDVLPILGARLADRDPAVRLAAARAVAHRGHRDGAGLLLLRLGVGDDEPEVVSESLRGLFAIAPDLGVQQARSMLAAASAQVRELALTALGTAAHDQAVQVLADELARCSLAEDRQRVIEALGLSLRPLARALLIELLRGERAADASAALEALSIHRYDARLVEQVREAVANLPALRARFAALYE